MGHFVLAEFSAMQMFVILLIILVLFGGAKVPQLMRNMGKGISEFKKGMKEGDEPEQAPSSEASKSKESVPSASNNKPN